MFRKTKVREILELLNRNLSANEIAQALERMLSSNGIINSEEETCYVPDLSDEYSAERGLILCIYKLGNISILTVHKMLPKTY